MSASAKSRFPIAQAFLFALQGIRLRLGRMLLVLAGVSVAIAFTNVLLTTNDLFESLLLRRKPSQPGIAAGSPRPAGPEKPSGLARRGLPQPAGPSGFQQSKSLPPDIPAEAQGLTGRAVFRWLWVAVALLICTAGTFNAIVMSVTERIKEIGTLKCLGSRNVHIVEIFLFESVLLGVLGGLLGGLLGYAVALLSFIASVGAKYLTAGMAAAAVVNVPICVGISALLALLASVVPVLMAARVEPAAAMRYEV